LKSIKIILTPPTSKEKKTNQNSLLHFYDVFIYHTYYLVSEPMKHRKHEVSLKRYSSEVKLLLLCNGYYTCANSHFSFYWRRHFVPNIIRIVLNIYTSFIFPSCISFIDDEWHFRLKHNKFILGSWTSCKNWKIL
jgi:hypothetical protein